MIYSACQIGLNVKLNDLAMHTFWDLNDYVARLVKNNGKPEVPAQSMSDFVKAGGKNYG